MLAGLLHAPAGGKSEGEQRLGISTIGSSEACMLGGLALKRRWAQARKKAGKSTEKPNLILGINAQVSLDHACTQKQGCCHNTFITYYTIHSLTLSLLLHSACFVGDFVADRDKQLTRHVCLAQM